MPPSKVKWARFWNGDDPNPHILIGTHTDILTKECKKNQVLLLFSIFLEGNKWLTLTRAGCCLNQPKNKKLNIKFSSQLKIKQTEQMFK